VAVEVMAGGAQDEDLFLTSSHGGLFGIYEFHGASGSAHRPWLCQHAPSIATGVDCPQAEESAKAADAHRIARVRIFVFCFSCRGSERKTDLSSCKKKKRSRQI
jgi:hypothetical protein